METEVLIVATVFFSISLVFGLWVYFRFKGRAERQQTIRLALEKGSELSPDFIKQLEEAKPSKDRDLRRGLIWVAIGIATTLFGLLVDEADAIGPLLGIATFPTLVGVAFLIMWRYGARQD